MNYRKNAEMLVLFPKRVLAPYRDLTRLPQSWLRYESPSCERLPARSVCAAQFGKKRTWNGVKFDRARRGR